MQKIVLALLYVVVSTVQASPVFNPNKSLKEATAPLSSSKKVESCANCSTEESFDFRQCIKQICGQDPIKNKTYMKDYLELRHRSEEIQHSSDWEKQKRKFDEWVKDIDTYGKEEQSELLRGRELILSGKDEVHQDLVDIAYLTSLFSFFELLEYEVVSSENGSVDIKYDNTVNQTKLPSFINYDEVKEFHRKMTIFSLNYNAGGIINLKERYPGKSIYEMLQLELKKAKIAILSIEKDPKSKLLLELMEEGGIASLERDIRVQEDRLNKKKESIDDHDIDGIVDFVTMITMLSDMFSGQSLFSVDPKVSQKFVKDIFKNEEFLKNLREADFSRNYDSEEKNVVLEECKTSYLEGQVALAGVPLAQAEEIVTKAKSSVLRSMAKRLSKTTLGVVEKHIANVHFAKPLYPDNFKESFDFYLGEAIKDDRDPGLKSSDVKYGKTSLTLSAMDAVFESIIKNKQPQDEFVKDTKYSSIKEFCEDYSTGVVDDSSLSIKTGKINVSWNSIRDPQGGHGIISHEIGHQISGIFKQNKNMSIPSSKLYSKARECLVNHNSFNKNHELTIVELPSGASSHNDGHFTEEDWADTVLAISGNDYNTWCYLVEHESDGNYLNETLDPKENDTHSSSMFRLLNIEYQMRGVLPPECSLSYLKSKGIEFQKCL